MGLTMVREVVQQRGWVWFESEEGRRAPRGYAEPMPLLDHFQPPLPLWILGLGCAPVDLEDTYQRTRHALRLGDGSFEDQR